MIPTNREPVLKYKFKFFFTSSPLQHAKTAFSEQFLSYVNSFSKRIQTHKQHNDINVNKIAIINQPIFYLYNKFEYKMHFSRYGEEIGSARCV